MKKPEEKKKKGKDAKAKNKNEADEEEAVENTMKWPSIPTFINDLSHLVRTDNAAQLNEILFKQTYAAS